MSRSFGGRTDVDSLRTYKEVEGEGAAEAKVAMQLGNIAAHPSQQSALDVVDVVAPLNIAVLLDGSHDLRIRQNLIIQLGAVAVNLVLPPVSNQDIHQIGFGL